MGGGGGFLKMVLRKKANLPMAHPLASQKK